MTSREAAARRRALERALTACYELIAKFSKELAQLTKEQQK